MQEKGAILFLGIAGLVVLLALLEQVFPLRQRGLNYWLHLVVNLTMSLMVYLTAHLSVAPATKRAIGWSDAQEFGLMHWLSLPPVVAGILGFLLLDLSFYYWHRANHEVPLLWRFHNVHHMDTQLDVSTGFRFHFVEVLYSTIFRVVQVLIIGVSLPVFAVFELVFQVCTLFHHSNVKLPLTLERLLNLFMVTPRMHSIHHSVVKDETNSNYSVIFRFWDYLHRTLNLNVPQGEITIGVAGYSHPEDRKLWRILLVPFAQQRDYWKYPDGTQPQRHFDRKAKQRVER